MLAARTTLFGPFRATCRGRFNCHTANEFGGLEFCRLTYPGRDRQQVGDGFCRIFSGGGETSPNF